MRTGNRKQRVAWQQCTTSNVSGQVKASYSTVGTYWARVSPLSGREGIIARQQRADVTHMVNLLNVGAIKPKDRFLYKNRILEITSVMNVDELDVPSAELNCVCIEVVS